MTRKRCLFFAITFAVALTALVNLNAQSSSPKKSVAPTLSAARQALAKKVGTESFAVSIESYALALGSSDAVALISEFAPKALESKRGQLYSLSASLSLVLGDYTAAAKALGRSAEGKAEPLIRACRCFLAAGDSAQAEKTLALVPDSQNGKSWVEAKRLVSAWSAVLSGKVSGAFTLLKGLAGESSAPESRREALFLLWMIASSTESESLGDQAKAFSAKEILDTLRAKFPGSMELAVAESRVAMKPSSWLLNSLRPVLAGKGEHSLAGKGQTAQGEAGSTSAVLLQLGWFSREDNAKSLATALKVKGFSASVNEKSGIGTEKRWAVIVETSGDWTKVQAKLKDLGYESYLLP